MKRRDYHIVPGAASLILIIVVLSMSVLGVLALLSARSDERLTVRSAAVAQELAQLNAASEHSLAALDEKLVEARTGAADDAAYLEALKQILPEGMELDGNTVSWTETDDSGRTLYCAVRLGSLADEQRCSWVDHRIGNEFTGMELEDTWN